MPRNAVFSLTVACLCAIGCSPPPRPPDVILVTFDTTRFDRIGVSGDPTASTPNVDALATRGLFFERAFAPTGLTLPSHTSIMTGLPPLAHGVHNNGRFRVPEEHVTLAERLREQGYQTGAFVSAYVLDHFFGLDQGFDHYDDRTEKGSSRLDFSVATRPGNEVTDSALAWLESADAEPVFLWAHYYDPHRPWTPNEGFEDRIDPYASEISFTDAEFGRLLEGFQRLREGEPVVVLTADHGEGLGQHGEETHGILAYDSVLHVPLLIAGPGLPQAQRTPVLSRHVDLLPTIAALVGLRADPNLPGRNLVEAARGSDNHPISLDGAAIAVSPGSSVKTRKIGPKAAQASNADAKSDVYDWFEAAGPHVDNGWAMIAGIRNTRWKYTATPAPAQLFDTLVDFHEEKNLAGVDTAVAAEMEEHFRAFEKRWRRESNEIRSDEIDLEQAERLAALGYVDARPASVSAESTVDPRKAIGTFAWVEEARSRATKGEFDRAIEILETLRRSAPVRALVLRSLGPIYLEAGRFTEAVEAMREYADLTKTDEAHVALARALVSAGRPEDALHEVEHIAIGNPTLAPLRAKANAKLGRTDEAQEILREAFGDSTAGLRALAVLIIELAPNDEAQAELQALLAEAPDDPYLLSWNGYYQAVWGDTESPDQALAKLTRALEVAEEVDPVLHANCGWGAFRVGQIDLARSELERALELDPASQLDRFRLALVAQAQDRNKEAIHLVRTALRTAPGAPWAPAARKLAAELGAQGRRVRKAQQ